MLAERSSQPSTLYQASCSLTRALIIFPPDLVCVLAVAMENIHSEMYSLLIDTYVKDTAEKTHLLEAIETVRPRPFPTSSE